MMTKRFNVALCLLLCCGMTYAQEQPPALDDGETENSAAVEPHVVDNRSGETLDLQALCDQLSHVDAVFLGEQHDNDSGHEFQLNVIRQLVDNGHKVVISMEQFERDVQGAVDDYLADRMDEETFTKVSRPWPNYQQHYRPIIEYAKEKGLPVIAGNIPRRIAGDVSKGNQPSATDRPLMPRQTTAPRDAYWDKFVATMQGHMGATGDERMQQFYASQCLKDDAMAEAITDYLATNGHESKMVVHLCGHFHSDFGLGTVARVVQRRPLIRIAVVTMENIPEQDEESDSKKADSKSMNDRAHYTFWTAPNSEKEDE